MADSTSSSGPPGFDEALRREEERLRAVQARIQEEKEQIEREQTRIRGERERLYRIDRAIDGVGLTAAGVFGLAGVAGIIWMLIELRAGNGPMASAIFLVLAGAFTVARRLLVWLQRRRECRTTQL
ncbi:hypothetical protein [Streptomyces sp. NBC_00203]|uniref:hypothetical protein n=1 Tax=Streptomyces sp. NBC_00203 TaxID=2975680 RepID=UPI0032530461